MQIAPGRCWRACCEIRPGETLVVVRLDRLARSVSHALAVIEQPCDNSTDEKTQLAQGQAGKTCSSRAQAPLCAPYAPPGRSQPPSGLGARQPLPAQVEDLH